MEIIKWSLINKRKAIVAVASLLVTWWDGSLIRWLFGQYSQFLTLQGFSQGDLLPSDTHVRTLSCIKVSPESQGCVYTHTVAPTHQPPAAHKDSRVVRVGWMEGWELDQFFPCDFPLEMSLLHLKTCPDNHCPQGAMSLLWIPRAHIGLLPHEACTAI